MGSGEGRLLLAISASLIIVLQAACSAPAPFGATLAMRALSATSVPMSSPKPVPLTQTDMRWAGDPSWSAPAHAVRARPAKRRTSDAARTLRVMRP